MPSKPDGSRPKRPEKPAARSIGNAFGLELPSDRTSYERPGRDPALPHEGPRPPSQHDLPAIRRTLLDVPAHIPEYSPTDPFHQRFPWFDTEGHVRSYLYRAATR